MLNLPEQTFSAVQAWNTSRVAPKSTDCHAPERTLWITRVFDGPVDNCCSIRLTYAGAMNSFVTGVVRALAEFISTLSSSNSDPSATDATATRQENAPRPRSTTSTPTRTPKPSDRSRPHGSSQHQDPATSKRPRTSIREASIADALAHASYQPIMDGDADPGEVVWTWVPYQEDASVGKDRPWPTHA